MTRAFFFLATILLTASPEAWEAWEAWDGSMGSMGRKHGTDGKLPHSSPRSQKLQEPSRPYKTATSGLRLAVAGGDGPAGRTHGTEAGEESVGGADVVGDLGA